jgi:hypothetical protein
MDEGAVLGKALGVDDDRVIARSDATEAKEARGLRSVAQIDIRLDIVECDVRVGHDGTRWIADCTFHVAVELGIRVE